MSGLRRADLPEPMVLVLEGHLTEQSLERALGHADARLVDGPKALIVDCTSMTGYDRAARELFVEWNKAHRDALTHVAIVTVKPVWRIVISAMSLASSQEMKAFDYLDDARRWIELGEEVEDAQRFIDG